MAFFIIASRWFSSGDGTGIDAIRNCASYAVSDFNDPRRIASIITIRYGFRRALVIRSNIAGIFATRNSESRTILINTASDTRSTGAYSAVKGSAL